VSEASGTYTNHFVIGCETELTKRLDFDVSFVWDRIQNPQAKSDGTVPKPDDIYLIFAVGFDF